ncbi:cyclic nucleotide-gated channel rod photoreceptor subunit alpha-like [Anneissia japonica]|uniref:cyclic nucleotide-gated channel rod photoreceptor subunit alpha-like n=1 Tax=Anneissia japonica TaxID=1529436 RepID=UPI0014256ABF|nr:cyclic nucleotide-gated channel rod photoreceptor subunit alpha-like [Anneissia japonica]
MTSLLTPIVSNSNNNSAVTVRSLTELPTDHKPQQIEKNGVFKHDSPAKPTLLRTLNGKVHPVNETDAGETMSSSARMSSTTFSSTYEAHDEESLVSGVSRQTPGGKRWSTLRNVMRATRPSVKRKRTKVSVQRVDSFLEKFTTRQREGAEEEGGLNDSKCDYETDEEDEYGCNFIAHPDGTFSFYWLFIVTMAVLYNLWLLIAREAWPEIQEDSLAIWFTFDYLCDIVYILDIFVQLRTGYLEQGLLQRNEAKLRQYYIHSWRFPVDIVSLTPLDLLYLIPSERRYHSMVRFPRFLKVYRARMWYYMLETRTPHPNFLRVGDLTHLILLLIHWAAAAYYLFSEAVGFGKGDWVYPEPIGSYSSTLRKYMQSMYWSTLTLTTIGDIPFPESNSEYAVQIVGYLIGVFIFASVVGQVGTVIENRNAARLAFERQLDNAKKYMRTNNVPTDVQTRVRRWYDYTWSRGHLSGEGDINSLGLLPTKLRTELALHVNLKTLKKVTMFNECPPEFLHDLVLKMPSIIYTPGDLICRKGEVAREMFIISDGYLEVMGDDATVLTTLKAGDFFGEIGILNIEGAANRRTADVRSVGYSELFTLSKEDVLGALRDYPQAQNVLEEEGRKRLNGRRVTPKSTEPSPNRPMVIQEVTDLSRDSSLERTAPQSAPGSLADVKMMKSKLETRKSLRPVEVSARKRRVAQVENSLTNEVMELVQKAVKDKLNKVASEARQLKKHSKELEKQVVDLEIQNEQQRLEIHRLQQKIKKLEIEPPPKPAAVTVVERATSMTPPPPRTPVTDKTSKTAAAPAIVEGAKPEGTT